MTRHLTPEQFVDVAEGATPEPSVPHLAECRECREELAGLRAMMSEAAPDAGDVPEPSPLFWSHLSSRVRDAVAGDAVRPRSWYGWLLQPRLLAPLGAALAVATIAFLLPRTPQPATMPAAPLPVGAEATVPASAPSLPPLLPFGASDDPQLRIVAAFAPPEVWDEMRDEVALSTGDSSEAVAGALTVDERRELQRLLAEEVGQPGAQEHRS